MICAVCTLTPSTVRCTEHATQMGDQVALVVDRSHLPALAALLANVRDVGRSEEQIAALWELRAAVEAAS